jgi:hypothetical protein
MLRCHAATISYSKDIHVASQQWGQEEATKWESDADGQGIWSAGQVKRLSEILDCLQHER